MAKNSKVVEPSSTINYGDIEVNFYDRKGGNVSVKITACDALVVYGKVQKYSDGAFLALPNYKNKDGERVSQAYIFDKKLIDKIQSHIDKHYAD